MVECKEYAAETDGRHTQGSVKLKLDGSTTIKLKQALHNRTGAFTGASALELSKGKWGLELNTNQDIALERKMKTRLGELKIKQRLPGARMFLIPSPEVKLSTKSMSVGKLKLKDSLDLSYDFQKGIAKLEEELVFDKWFKAKLECDSAKGLHGAQLAFTAKLERPYLSCLGLNLSRAVGPVWKYEVGLGKKDAVKAKIDYKLRSGEARMELQPKLQKGVRLTMTAIVQTAKPEVAPKLLLGIKYDD